MHYSDRYSTFLRISAHIIITCIKTGVSPGFSFRGRGAKGYARAEHMTSGKSVTPVTAGVQGPGSSIVLDALSCYLSLFFFKHSDTKRETKVDQI